MNPHRSERAAQKKKRQRDSQIYRGRVLKFRIPLIPAESHAEPEHRGRPLLRRFAICDPKWPPTRPQRGHIAPSPVSSRNEADSGGGRLLRATTVSGPSRHRSPPRRPAQGRNATRVSDARLTDNACRSPTRCLMAAPRRRRRRRHRAQGRTTKCLHFIRGLVRVGARVGDS